MLKAAAESTGADLGDRRPTVILVCGRKLIVRQKKATPREIA